MPRPEFKDRHVSIYFKSGREKKLWEDFAEKRGTTLSNLFLEGLTALRDQETSRPQPGLIKELESIKDELARTKHELNLKADLLRLYETETFKSRHAAFSSPDPERDGLRDYSKALIDLLRGHKRAFNSEDLLQRLSIDVNDKEATALVWNQLESLQRFGLVHETRFGWKWSE